MQCCKTKVVQLHNSPLLYTISVTLWKAKISFSKANTTYLNVGPGPISSIIWWQFINGFILYLNWMEQTSYERGKSAACDATFSFCAIWCIIIPRMLMYNLMQPKTSWPTKWTSYLSLAINWAIQNHVDWRIIPRKQPHQKEGCQEHKHLPENDDSDLLQQHV